MKESSSTTTAIIAGLVLASAGYMISKNKNSKTDQLEEGFSRA
jgi:hypothetical protein